MIRARSGLLIAAVGLSLAAALAVVLVPYLRERAKIAAVAERAREAVTANREADARKLLAEWASLDPRDGESDYYRARLEVQTDHPAEALDAMRRSIARKYPEEPLMILRAVLLARAGKFDEAEPVLTAAFARGAEPRVEVAEGLSRIYLRNFRLTEASRVLEAWMKAAPEDPRPYLRRNEVDARINAEPAVLVRNFREALRRDPNLIEARLGLAERLREASQFDEAEVEYDALLERDPTNLQGLVGAGRVAILKGDLPAATRRFEAALKVDPKEKVALRELALIDLSGGRNAQAVARLRQAVEADPFDPEIRYTYSRALKALGETDRAAEEAAATERLKKEQQRVIDLRQDLVQHPDDVDLRAEAAKWLIEHGHEKEGLEWTALILKQKPGHPATCRLLVDYYTRQGKLGLANFYRIDAAPAK